MEINHVDIHSEFYEDLIGLDVYHYSSKYNLTLNNETCVVRGFGSSLNKQLAHTKSVFELLERITFHYESKKNKIKSSNGFASHHEEILACKNAYLEIIERDTFFQHWFNKSAGKDITDTIHLYNSLFFKSFLSFCEKNDYRFTLKSLLVANDVYVLMGIVYDKTESIGGFINTAAGTDLYSTIENIITNLSRDLNTIQVRKIENISIIKNIQIPKTPSEHFEYYLDKNNFKNIKWILNSNIEHQWNDKYDKKWGLKLSFQ